MFCTSVRWWGCFTGSSMGWNRSAWGCGTMRFMDEQNKPLPEDPSGIQEPHDVLAAEEFGIGVRDERLPPDPSGIHEPHDVLAAEEFAMPAGDVPAHHADGHSDPRSWMPLALLAGAVLLVWLRRRRYG
jgi:MYXO-CTERM domain-containing protein